MSRKLKTRILCVDDDPDVGALLVRLFEGTGRFTVAVETNSHRAIQTARTFRPDLVVLDVMMPGQTGAEVARQLRSEPWVRFRPILLFSGLPAFRVNVEMAKGDGPTEFLQKGVTLDTVLETVDAMLRAAQTAEAPHPAAHTHRTGPRTACWPSPSERLAASLPARPGLRLLPS